MLHELTSYTKAGAICAGHRNMNNEEVAQAAGEWMMRNSAKEAVYTERIAARRSFFKAYHEHRKIDIAVSA